MSFKAYYRAASIRVDARACDATATYRGAREKIYMPCAYICRREPNRHAVGDKK